MTLKKRSIEDKNNLPKRFYFNLTKVGIYLKWGWGRLVNTFKNRAEIKRSLKLDLCRLSLQLIFSFRITTIQNSEVRVIRRTNEQ